MIGLGKWEFNVDTFVYKGGATIEISNKNGKYDFKVAMLEMDKTPQYYVDSVKEEGNTLTLTGTSDIMPGKEVKVVATFENNVCNGYIKIPILGKIKINNGKKIG